MMQKTNTSSRIKDISFANIFWRKFAIRMAALLLMSILILTFGQNITMMFVQQRVDSLLTKTSLSLAQLEDSNIAEDKMRTMANVILSSAQEELDNTGFIVDSSLTLYNMSKQELISHSFNIPVVDSDELIDWWRKQAGVESGLPIIFLSDEMELFCKKYQSNDIYIKKLYCINSVLFPSSIVAKSASGNELETCESTIPSLSTQYPKLTQIPLKIIGNQVGDTVYDLMANFKFQSSNAIGNSEPIVVYDDAIDGETVKIWSNKFTINKTNYQVNCGYQTSFWAGAWIYIILFEALGILVCAAVAFANTKETLAVYH